MRRGKTNRDQILQSRRRHGDETPNRSTRWRHEQMSSSFLYGFPSPITVCPRSIVAMTLVDQSQIIRFSGYDLFQSGVRV